MWSEFNLIGLNIKEGRQRKRGRRFVFVCGRNSVVHHVDTNTLPRVVESLIRMSLYPLFQDGIFPVSRTWKCISEGEKPRCFTMLLLVNTRAFLSRDCLMREQLPPAHTRADLARWRQEQLSVSTGPTPAWWGRGDSWRAHEDFPFRWTGVWQRNSPRLPAACPSLEWQGLQRSSSKELLLIHGIVKPVKDDDALECFNATLPSPSLARTSAWWSQQVSQVSEQLSVLIPVDLFGAHQNYHWFFPGSSQRLRWWWVCSCRRNERWTNSFDLPKTISNPASNFKLVSLALSGKSLDFNNAITMIVEVVALLNGYRVMKAHLCAAGLGGRGARAEGLSWSCQVWKRRELCKQSQRGGRAAAQQDSASCCPNQRGVMFAVSSAMKTAKSCEVGLARQGWDELQTSKAHRWVGLPE